MHHLAPSPNDRTATPPLLSFATPPGLPEGDELELPGRGTTFVRDAAGPDGAPTLLLLHGWTATAGLNWFRSFPHLRTRYRVVALDHRGHGRGIRSRRRFRLEDCADDAVAVMDALGIDRFIPVGYSMGGPIAQLVWRRHAARVEGLVLCATSRNFKGSPAEKALFSVVTGLSLAARITPSTWRASIGERVLTRKVEDTELGQWARAEVRRNDPRVIAEAGHAIGTFSSHDWIGDLDAPTAVVVTDLDTVVPPTRQRKLADAIGGATVHPVKGDHSSCATAPDAFVPALLDACASVTARAARRDGLAG